MTSTIKVDNIQNQCGANIINESSNTITIGASGDTVSLASGASQTGFGRTGTVDWDTTAKTASFTAVSGNGYFANTSGGAFTMTLPAGSAGAIVSVADYGDNFATNNLTITADGSDKIGGETVDATLQTNGQSVTLVFVDSTEGWITVNDSSENVKGSPFILATGGTVTTCGNCKVHTFTGPGTFTVTKVACSAPNNVVSYAVVAGGGSGGMGNNTGGGGGAGGYREVKSPATTYTASPLDGYPSAPNRVTVTATAFPITVGAGGAAVSGSPTSTTGNNGSNSVFSTITSAGGGGGGAYPAVTANDGGSGGGESNGGGIGSGNTPPVSPPQGNDGGSGAAPGIALGGGGGAGVAGGTGGPTAPGGAGGNGTPSNISGTDVTRAGGGGGGGNNPGGTPDGGGAGGTGGGGNGGGTPTPGPSGTAGTANTGGGGGGNGKAATDSNAGGSGIVIIRYKFQ